MPVFSYKGRQHNGELVEGSLEASDQASVARILVTRRITPTVIENGKTKTSKQSGASFDLFKAKVTLTELVLFSRQMYSLTKAGIPIIRAVAGLSQANNKTMQNALTKVIEDLEKGRSLSSALTNHPDIFNQLFVSVVHVGENTGKLDEAFLQLAQYLEREQETRKQIKAATRYPTFVIVALVIALVVMNIFVIPVFADMFSKFGTELPAMTLFLLAMSDFFVSKWYLLIGFILLSVLITKKYLHTQNGRYLWDKKKLTMPLIGSVINRSLLGRFSRSFSMMLRSGVPLTVALNLVADAVDNTYMKASILKMRQNIEKGENLSRAANSSQLFTPLVMQMISVGEETGRIDELLQEVAEYYEREVDYDLKSLTSKVEPILISIVAVMVLVLALGIFTPMWDMMGAVQN